MDYAVARESISVAVAVADHRPPPVSQRTRRGSAAMSMSISMSPSSPSSSKQHQQQQLGRRQALEQEVAELKQQLSNEHTVHDILERALQPSAGRSAVLTIPAFIPTKAKELLAELLLVEEEIARLEDQIHSMKQQHQQQPPLLSAPDAPAKSPRPSAAHDNNNAPLLHLQQHHRQQQQKNPPPPSPPEIKSMFFISQAMDGDYLNKHVNNKQRQHSPKAAATMAMSSDDKNNAFPLPPSSRHSLDKQHPAAADRPKKILLHELPISSNKQSTTNRSRNTNNLQPNKLSERIVKCLVCIFIRLLRSSRAADLDKSGNLASRSGNTQGGSFSFSFRMDTSLDVAKDSKDRGQQDHYGIFDIQDAIVRDIGPYKNLVSFTSTSFDLRGFSASPLLSKLRAMLEALHHVDLRSLNHQQKLAFWLNVYNTCIMHGILQHGLPSNSDKLLALKNKATINVSGQKFNALVIENFILRQPSSVKEELWKCDVDVEEQQVREVYGLKSSEPNILFAMCCGIRSSPALRIYKADRVAMDLEKAKLEYLQASLVVTTTRRLLIPSLIHSNMHDFAKDMESLLRWICDQLPTSWSLRKSMVECLSSLMRHNFKTMEEAVDVIPFDYEFQYLLLPM